MEIEEVSNFVKAHYEFQPDWSEEQVNNFFVWYRQNAGLGISYKNGEITGVACARCIKNIEDRYTYYVHDEAADNIWVDLVVTNDESALETLWHCMLKRWGHRLRIGFNRKKYHNRGRMYLMKHLTEKIYGRSFAAGA
jgi:hypothetical protein